MAFRVKYTLKAEDDLDGILTWLLQRQAGEQGLRWFKGLISRVSTLSELPGRCPLAREAKSVPVEVRQLLYGNKPYVYRVLFTITDDVVNVIRIRGPHQPDVSLQ
jgi:plasmid stabilization system protein ParE